VPHPAFANIRVSIALARRVAAGSVAGSDDAKRTFVTDRYFTPRVEPPLQDWNTYVEGYHHVPKVSDLIDILRGLETKDDALAPFRSVKEHGLRGNGGRYFADDEDANMYYVRVQSAVSSETIKHALFNRWQTPLLECWRAVDIWANPNKPGSNNWTIPRS